MKFVANAIIWVEPLLMAIVLAAFWFPEPTRVNSLPLLLPSLVARAILYRKPWRNTPITSVLCLFLILIIANTYVALINPTFPPYSWGWYTVGRPLMGIVIAFLLMSRVQERRRLDDLLLVVLLVGLVVGILGLCSAQYTTKSNQLEFIIQLLPRINWFPGAEGGFNVNEIGGALAYFAPLAAGVAIHDWRFGGQRLRRSVATAAFIVLMLALFLGQSRLAIGGVVAALGMLTFLLIPKGRWRYAALAALLIFSGVEALIIGRVFETPEAAAMMDVRDEDSFMVRLQIWDAGLKIVRDHPLTGVGLNMYRAGQVREEYPVPGFSSPVVPHAHNELLQVGTDAGVPGMILFVLWHVLLGVMLWRAWQRGDWFLKSVTAAVAAGLLAHAFFGLADAISLFDRFVFVYWLLIGLGGGVYLLACREPEAVTPGRIETFTKQGVGSEIK